MKKIIMIALLAVFATITASAQKAENVIKNWQKTISVPNSQATIIEKLFTAWAKEFPGYFVEAFNKGKQTGHAENIKFNEEYNFDFQVDFAPKNGYLQILAEVQLDEVLTAVYWNLPNGNKLFAVSIHECQECGECGEEADYAKCDFALAFYEYNATKATLTPRPEISKKILAQTDYVRLPKEGRDLSYWDEKSQSEKIIKWNGNGF